jgi:hypothetical protein
MSRRSLTTCFTIAAAVSTLAVARPSEAGRCAPLCRTFDIGDARSLPWGDRWASAQSDYDLRRLVTDTDALLVATTPVIVRMETLRRAGIYAAHDRLVAEQLFAGLMERARASERAGRPDPLRFFDAAYLANTLYQIGEVDDASEMRALAPNVKGLVRDVDAYALIRKSLALRQDDPELHFAAALVASLRPEHREFCATHARKARVGAAGHALLIRNLHYIS